MIRLLSSNVSRLGIVAAMAALMAVVFTGVGLQSWALAMLSLSLCLIAGAVVAGHDVTTRMARRQREVAQRDHRQVMAALNGTAGRIDRLVAGGSGRSGRSAVPVTVGNSLDCQGAFWGVGPEYEYAQRYRVARSHYETFALRSKSVALRDSFARAATGLQFNAEDTIRILRALSAGKLSGAQEIVAGWDADSLLTLARVMANQRLRAGDIAGSLLIFETVVSVFGLSALKRTDVYVYTEVLAESGMHGQASQTFRETGLARRDPVQASLIGLNGFAAAGLGDDGTRRKWTDGLAALLAREGLAPIAFRDMLHPSPLDSLTSTVAPRQVDGPLVSVLIPTHNGSAFLETTLRGLAEQTWKRLEIIVIDDASDDEHATRIRQICAEFADVTLVRQEVNGGAYLARNRGLQVATGRFITVHDDDDWSHPQKIEVQATHLLREPQAAANMTRHARSYEDLRLTRINNNPSFSQPNFSSLMFHRDLITAIGPWDEVNRGADSEFRDRLVLHSGRPVEVLLEAPLSFTRTRTGSLTSGEMGRGYVDPSRLMYLASYKRAHEAAQSGGAGSLQMDFPRPLNMEPDRRGADLGHFDVVFATDFRFPGGTTSLSVNEVRAAADAGLRVGVVQLDSPLNSPSEKVREPILREAMRPNVEILSLSDAAAVDVLIVRHPSVLQFADTLTSRLRVSRVLVVINNPPILRGGRGVVFSAEDAVAHAMQLFGIAPVVMAESGVTRELALGMTPPNVLSSDTWPGFIDTDRFRTEGRHARPGTVPTLGRHSRDAELKWPDSPRTVLSVYGGDKQMRTRILGGISSLPSGVQQSLRECADVLEFGSEPPEEFLQSLDFWAYFHSDRLTESFGMSAVEAMASGAVVFLPPYMRQTFHDGALYCAAEEVHAEALRLWNDPEAYLAQSRRGVECARTHFSTSAFLSRLQTQLDLVRAAPKDELARTAGPHGTNHG